MKYAVLFIFVCCLSCTNTANNTPVSAPVAQGKTNNNKFEWSDSEASYRPLTDADEALVVEKLGLLEMVDDSRWRFYCAYSLLSAQYSDTTRHLYLLPDSISFSEMKLTLVMVMNMQMEDAPRFYPFADYGIALAFRLPGLPHVVEWPHVVLPISTDVYRCNSLACLFDRYIFFMQYFKGKPNHPVIITGLSRNDMMLHDRILYKKSKAPYYFSEQQFELHARIAEPLTPEVTDFIKRNAAKLHPWFYNEAVKRGVIDSVHYPHRA